jgi:molecular chaperone DnaJ
MSRRDFYDVLGVDKGNDDAEIKRAYRSLAMKYHPDRNPGDTHAMDKMKEINEAYAVLSDRKKRQIYDTYGHAGLEGMSTSDIFSSVDFGSLFSEFGLGDIGFGGGIFDTLFGASGKSSRKRSRGADLRYDLEITLEEAASGIEKIIKIPSKRVCSSCRGSGAREGGLHSCDKCHGTGQVVVEQKAAFGVFRQISACPYCQGIGKEIKDKCDLCSGQGFLEDISELTVSIPKGADSGYNIRFQGEGESDGGSITPGDLYVVVSVKEHSLFERRGDDIFLAHEIEFTHAALGAVLDDVPGLEGNVTLEIPGGTQAGEILRIRSKGIPHLKGTGRGDQYVMVKPVTPKNLSEREKELLREFESLRKGKTAKSVPGK